MFYAFFFFVFMRPVRHAFAIISVLMFLYVVKRHSVYFTFNIKLVKRNIKNFKTTSTTPTVPTRSRTRTDL